MFGCIVAGRQIQTNLQQVDPGKYVFILPEPTKINHLVVFTTDPFQAGFGASLYYNTAKQQEAGSAWQFLGVLTNDKPSAIFRVKQQNHCDNLMEMEDYGEVGISIEPLHVLESLTSEKALVVASSTQNTTSSTLQRLAENGFNYLSSFAKSALEYGQEQVVPLRCLQDCGSNRLKDMQSPQQNALSQVLRYPSKHITALGNACSEAKVTFHGWNFKSQMPPNSDNSTWSVENSIPLYAENRSNHLMQFLITFNYFVRYDCSGYLDSFPHIIRICREDYQKGITPRRVNDPSVPSPKPADLCK